MREFGYAEMPGEKWVIYRDNTLIVAHPERPVKMFRRGHRGEFTEIVPPWDF